MINPKELRTGNWIRVEGEDSANIEINQIGFNTNGFKGYWVGSKGQSILLDPNDNDLVSGIPLTHEIMEKAGFSYHHTNPTVSEWFIHDNPNMLGAIVFEDDKYVYEGYEHEIKSVHQLQNLFHALTGEELEIKL